MESMSQKFLLDFVKKLRQSSFEIHRAMTNCKQRCLRFITLKATLCCSLLFYFAFPEYCSAQMTDCDQTLITLIDSISQERMIQTRKDIIVSEDGGKTGFVVYGIYRDENITLTIHCIGAGTCLNKGDKVEFDFADSTNLTLANMDEDQLPGTICFNTGLNNANQLHLLADKQIAGITVRTKTEFLTRKISDQTSTEIHKLLLCLDEVFSTNAKSAGAEIFTILEARPEFIGGYGAMTNFIRQNLKLPKGWKAKDAVGTVQIQFVIAKDGAVTEVRTVRSLHPELDQEAERVVKMMPAWKPGIQNGKFVSVRFILPVRFN